MRIEMLQPGVRVRNMRTGREGVVVAVRGGDAANTRVVIDYDVTGRRDDNGTRLDCVALA
jgi:hypothetical protein